MFRLHGGTRNDKKVRVRSCCLLKNKQSYGGIFRTVMIPSDIPYKDYRETKAIVLVTIQTASF